MFGPADARRMPNGVRRSAKILPGIFRVRMAITALLLMMMMTVCAAVVVSRLLGGITSPGTRAHLV